MAFSTPRRPRLMALACLTLLALIPRPAAAQTEPAAAAPPMEARFAAAPSTQTWPLASLPTPLPADWTSAQFLVLELRAEVAQEIDFQLVTARGSFSYPLHPFSGVWQRMVIPLGPLQTPAGPSPTGLLDSLESGYTPDQAAQVGPLATVRALGFSQSEATVAQRVELRAARLAAADPGTAILEPLPAVDAYGQWIPADWATKATSLGGLRNDWNAEQPAPAEPPKGLDRFGGIADGATTATGFFRVARLDGRWWLIDPEGHRFYAHGVGKITPEVPTRIEGREPLFAALPSVGFFKGLFAGRGPTASFYNWNLQREFGSESKLEKQWPGEVQRRLGDWGLNLIADADPALTAKPAVPYTLTLEGWPMENAVLGLPDAYDEKFAAAVEKAVANICDARRNDPWLVGYYLGQPPEWPGRELEVVDRIQHGPETAIKRALDVFLLTGGEEERRRGFVLDAYDLFLSTVADAVRRHDPNHMILGVRLRGRPPLPIVQLAARFDVYSFECWRDAPDPGYVKVLSELTSRPLLIDAFGFGAPRRGLSGGPVAVADEAARAAAYRRFATRTARLPEVVGMLWSQWTDDPASGRAPAEGEATASDAPTPGANLGLVDITDRPYTELTRAMKETGPELAKLHAGHPGGPE